MLASTGCEAAMDGFVEKYGIGQPVRRREDVRLLTGTGHYTDDSDPPGCLHAAVLRSPHAHARILSIHVADAQAMPGVVAVLTGAEAEADGLGHLPLLVDVPTNGEKLFHPTRRVLQTDAVRYVGDPIAFVVAETRAQALDAAEAILVDYEPLPAIVETGRAMDDDAPLVWPERGHNACVVWDNGRRAEADAAFAQAARIVTIELVQNRLVGNPMEPRVALGEWDAARGRYVLTCPTQGVVRVREMLAQHVLRVPKEQLRVISPDVGGGFGLRGKIFAESALVCWAARKLGRPVKWLAGRTETMQADPHGRDHVTRAEMAFDADARMLGVRVRTDAAVGAYCSDLGPRVPTIAGARIMGTVYDVQAVDWQVRCVFTHTVPTDAYRGAGRPEQAYVLERLLDLGAAEFGIGREEIRARNYVRPEQMPYRNVVGNFIDSGRFEETQAKAMALADWAGFPARRAAAEARGLRRGIGIGYFIEASGAQPTEWARLTMREDGIAELRVGTFSHGQGHETVFPQIVAERLGIPYERVRLIQGDSDEVPQGGGTGGSRSSQMGGVATHRASLAVVEKARRIAAHLLEASTLDIEFEGGVFRIAGTDRAIGWDRVVAAAHDASRLPAGEAPGLDEQLTYKRDTECNFPNGAHVAEVEVDPETGVLRVVNYVAVDDVGVVLNPMIVHGQVHGAIVQGIGQTLIEHAQYDAESGQFLTATFQDYAMPRADDAPDLTVGFNVVPTPTNELGVKGAGEGGCCGAPPAIVSAACDALGVAHIDMPLTPEKVWRALRAG
jgi:carbon-monoxide dehydrogenase large subunit